MLKYKMNFLGNNIWLACFVLTVFTTLVAVNAEEERTLDLKLGFDLTRGENGGPALRIREFEDSLGVKPRVQEEEGNEGESSSKEAKPKEIKSAEQSDKHNEDDFSAENDEDDDDDEYKKHITRGLSGNVDAEERPSMHDRVDDNDEDSRRRRKRSAGDYLSKRKNKKYASARKLMAPFLKMLRQ